jgi:hypothetical protein
VALSPPVPQTAARGSVNLGSSSNHPQLTESKIEYISQVDINDLGVEYCGFAFIINVCYLETFTGMNLINTVNATATNLTMVSKYFWDSECARYSGDTYESTLPLECRPNEVCSKFVISDAPFVPPSMVLFYNLVLVKK